MAEYTHTDVELVRAAWRNASCPICDSQRAGCHVLTDNQVRDYRAISVLSALAAAGRLTPPDAETEWGWLSADGVTVYPSLSEQDARRAAARSGARTPMRRVRGPWQRAEGGTDDA